MYISKDLGFAAHPKTASEAIAEGLRKRGWRQVGGHHDIVPFDGPVFCVVREPKDWLTSWYFYLGNGAPFEEWLEVWNNPLAKDGEHWFALEVCEYVLFYDDLQAGLDSLFEGEFELPYLNVSLSRRGIGADVLFEPPSVKKIFQRRYGEFDTLYRQLLSKKGSAILLRTTR